MPIRRQVEHYVTRAKQAKGNFSKWSEDSKGGELHEAQYALRVEGDQGGTMVGSNSGTINNYLGRHEHEDGLMQSFDLDREFKKSLAFAAFNKNEIQMKTSPCEWILDNDQYCNWIEQDGGLLRLKGPPGCGKSAAVKHALDRHRSDYQDELTLAFFFQTLLDTESARLDFCKSILCQILRETGDECAALAELKDQFKNGVDGDVDRSRLWIWTEDHLERYMIRAIVGISKARKVTMFVDALDKTDNRSGTSSVGSKFVSVFNEIINKANEESGNVRICFSAREFRAATIPATAYSIDVHHANAPALQNHVNGVLEKEKYRLEGLEIDSLSVTIETRARGSFLVAKRALEMSIGVWEKYHDFPMVSREVQNIPMKLDDMWGEQFSFENDADRQASLTLLQWVAFSSPKLTVKELKYARLLPPEVNCELLHADLEERVRTESWSESGASVWVNSVSCGLAEVTEAGIVDLKENAMNDFVRNDEVMHRIFGAALRPSVSFAQSGHARVTAGCLQYLHSAMQSQKRALLENLDQPWSWLEEQYRGLNKRRPNPLQRIWQEDEFPFWSYASRNWRKHLSSAEIDQVSHDNLMVVIQRDCILMDFLINHQRGIDVCTTGSCAKKQLRKRFCQPMRKAIKATLEKKGEDVRADTQVQGLFWHICAESGLVSAFPELLRSARASIDSPEFQYDKTPFFTAVEHGHVELVREFLGVKGSPIDINRRSYYGGQYCTPLEVAIAQDNKDLVKVIDAGNNGAKMSHEGLDLKAIQGILKETGRFFGEPVAYQTSRIRWALHCHAMDCIAYYLDAQPGLLGNWDDIMTAWETVACRSKSRKTGETDVLLLRNSIFPAVEALSLQRNWQKLLTDSMQTVSCEVAEELLTTSRVSINAQASTSSHTLLHAAIAGDDPHTNLITLLLSHGADPNISTPAGDTSLHEAITRRHASLIPLLAPHADFTATTAAGLGALHLAIAKKTAADAPNATLAALLALGTPDVNARNPLTAETALHQAVKWADRASVRLLLADARIDTTLRDAKGLTPLAGALRQMRKFERLAAGETTVGAGALRRRPDFEEAARRAAGPESKRARLQGALRRDVAEALGVDIRELKTPLEIAWEQVARLRDPAASEAVCRAWWEGYRDVREMIVEGAFARGVDVSAELEGGGEEGERRMLWPGEGWWEDEGDAAGVAGVPEAHAAGETAEAPMDGDGAKGVAVKEEVDSGVRVVL